MFNYFRPSLLPLTILPRRDKPLFSGITHEQAVTFVKQRKYHIKQGPTTDAQSNDLEFDLSA